MGLINKDRLSKALEGVNDIEMARDIVKMFPAEYDIDAVLKKLEERAFFREREEKILREAGNTKHADAAHAQLLAIQRDIEIVKEG
jgi:6-phosphogluconate dehydrogenase (decarboxylating)